MHPNLLLRRKRHAANLWAATARRDAPVDIAPRTRGHTFRSPEGPLSEETVGRTCGSMPQTRESRAIQRLRQFAEIQPDCGPSASPNNTAFHVERLHEPPPNVSLEEWRCRLHPPGMFIKLIESNHKFKPLPGLKICYHVCFCRYVVYIII